MSAEKDAMAVVGQIIDGLAFDNRALRGALQALVDVLAAINAIEMDPNVVIDRGRQIAALSDPHSAARAAAVALLNQQAGVDGD